MALNELVLKSRGKLKSTPTVSVSSPSTGPMSSDIETSGQSTGQQLSLSMSCAEGSPAKTSALPGNALALMVNAQACGVNTSESFAHFDRDSSSWKTYQGSLLTNTWDAFSETWPRAGTMRNGIVYQQQQLAPLTDATGSGLWPTPIVDDASNCGGKSRVRNMLKGQYQGLNAFVVSNLGEPHGSLNPNWVEWLMGYPIGWTDLGDSATPLSRKLRNGSDGKS